MAEEKKNFPQIPSRVWWDVRSILQSRPSAKLTDVVLATQLSVQPSAAKIYLSHLKLSGLIDDDGSATELANKWRNDATYDEAVQEILSFAYPKELVEAYPRGDADVQKVTEWFQYGGLGSGTARNKAATYVLIANGKPEDAKSATAPREKKAGAEPAKPAARVNSEKTGVKPKSRRTVSNESSPKADLGDLPSLNLNIQIHISADASTEQIETIFKSMDKYLRT